MTEELWQELECIVRKANAGLQSKIAAMGIPNEYLHFFSMELVKASGGDGE